MAEEDVGFAWSWRPQRRRKAMEDALFEEGDNTVGDGVKQTGLQLSSDEEDDNRLNGPQFRCQIAKCAMVFTSIADYEMHYSNTHRNVCTDCRRHFANGHLLDVHILETHNPMFTLLAEKQPMYLCLVEMCSEKFMTATDRRHHLVDNHKYPPNFRFNQTKESKKKTQKKNPAVAGAKKGAGSTTSSPKMEIALGCGALSNDVTSEVAAMDAEVVSERLQQVETPGEDEVKNTSMSESGRRFVYNVPKNICFGAGSQRGFARSRSRGRGRGGQGKKHWHQSEKTDKSKVNIEEVDMTDLSNALEMT